MLCVIAVPVICDRSNILPGFHGVSTAPCCNSCLIKIWFNYDVILNDFVETPMTGARVDVQHADQGPVCTVNSARFYRRKPVRVIITQIFKSN
jgi:hypothetical protein